MDQNHSLTSELPILPRIVVLIPHFNNLKGLVKTLKSLCYNGSMDVVVVDDGSEEKPKKTEISTSGKFRLHFLYLEHNLGVEKALNKGLGYINKNIKSDYIARIDSGDIQLADRLNKQVDFLEKNPEIGLLGTAAEFVDKNDTISFSVKYPLSNNKIRKHMGLRCSILHPTVMFRTNLLHSSEPYPSKYPYADDYAFIYSLLKSTKAANLPEVLTRIEQSEMSTSVKNRKRQLKSRIQVIYDNFSSSPFSTFGIFYTSIMILVPNKIIVNLKSRIS